MLCVSQWLAVELKKVGVPRLRVSARRSPTGQSTANCPVTGEIRPDAIDETLFADQLQLAGAPEPDLFIRTGGEQRISNFLLWNLAYSELYFCDTLWPDFDDAALDAALRFYASRQRRFGLTEAQASR